MESLYIVVPAYNEQLNIETTIKQWYPIVEKYNGGGLSRLVVVNDGSTDKTGDILGQLEKTMPLLKPLKKKNGGHGSSVLYGYRYAIHKRADYIFQTDADGQTNPDEFDAFWKMKDQYDAVIGKRTVRGDGQSRKFVENTVCLLLRIVFGVKVSDANAPFRLMKTALVKKYIRKLPENYNLPNIMMTTYFVYYHEKVCFLEISFKPRRAGKNSINGKKIMKIGWEALGDFRRLKKEL
ncbi:MAG: glycosyltransferase family 2 protein [Eubacteriales bacterium]|nr:glycosyltransferase family 2 protein [Eubacteriales bacterium]